MEQMAASKMFQSAVSFPQGRLLQVGFFWQIELFFMKFWEGKWYVKATVWPVRQRKYRQLVHWRQFPAPQLICLSLLWLLIGWFWSIILIGCCEHPSFIHNTKWKTAVRNLVSMAWHDLHDGFRLRHRNIYHTWISRSFFYSWSSLLQLKILSQFFL